MVRFSAESGCKRRNGWELQWVRTGAPVDIGNGMTSVLSVEITPRYRFSKFHQPKLVSALALHASTEHLEAGDITNLTPPEAGPWGGFLCESSSTGSVLERKIWPIPPSRHAVGPWGLIDERD
ncbi:MAG: hypothetical protein JWN85_1420 [Gammaproteobacteria bacterium]|nr:hypothetical protein [Gammaproteobacteria bacterium]